VGGRGKTTLTLWYNIYLFKYMEIILVRWIFFYILFSEPSDIQKWWFGIKIKFLFLTFFRQKVGGQFLCLALGDRSHHQSFRVNDLLDFRTWNQTCLLPMQQQRNTRIGKLAESHH
jgi:hypothetical protein